MLWQSILLTVLVAAAPAVKRDVLEKKFPDGSVRLRREVVLGDGGQPTNDGLQTKFYANGKKAEEVRYVKGIKDGPWTTWYDSGQKSGEGTYKAGLNHGHEIRYLTNGSKYLETNFEVGAGTANRSTSTRTAARRAKRITCKECCPGN